MREGHRGDRGQHEASQGYPGGKTVTCTATLQEVNGNRLLFHVEADDETVRSVRECMKDSSLTTGVSRKN
jgi:predicted thioesterase